MVFIDFKAAFDRVDRRKLFKKSEWNRDRGRMSKMIGAMYRKTKNRIATGEEREYF